MVFSNRNFSGSSWSMIVFKRGSVPPRCPLGSAILREFFSEKRLELKSLRGQTKAEELVAPCPKLLSLRLSLKAL